MPVDQPASKQGSSTTLLSPVCHYFSTWKAMTLTRHPLRVQTIVKTEVKTDLFNLVTTGTFYNTLIHGNHPHSSGVPST